MILNRDKTVVFAGRQTLFFNMKRYGIKNFQLSEKLFTRYSAISLQKGCLFLDILNEKYEIKFIAFQKREVKFLKATLEGCVM